MSDKTPLDPNQPVLYIDHCRYRENFRRDALQLHVSLAEALRALHPRVKLQLRINEHGPPEEEGAFEVAIAATPAESPSDRQHIWTGLRRVPFAAKVPHVDDIITPVCNALQLVRDDDHTDGESHRRKMANLRRSRSPR
ncbi:selenoprotein BthD [Drosophila persimilis]|uniref:Selenoprotein BthD n=1 Tax=Drosophila pseudoobscura pseudoobscura TaxID=46245 RepID=A0A6I8UKQ2_DROPS|nr:selenoprotein BthD [Drosophila pseudoobscura]XP_026843970.1 selenoprotein BthD [Drosophila persimilis]